MLKIIKKALLLASFVFSSVFPMRQVAQIALENIFPKKQVAQVMLARTLNQSVFVHNSLAAKSSVIASIAILAKNIEAKAMFTEDIFLGLFESVANDCKKNGTRDQIYHDLKNGHSFIVMNGANWQGSSESGAPTCGCSSQLGSTNFTGSSSVDMVHQGLLSGNSLEAEEHLFKIEHNAQRQEMQEEYFENVKKQVNFISANYSTIIQNKTAELVKSCSLSSRQELLDKKWDLANRLTDLEKRFEYLKEKNVHVKYIFDIAPTNNPHHSHGSIYCDIKENLPDKEYFEVLEAIWLKTNIESIKAAMQECDWRIFRFEQEARDSISSKLENEFIDTIEKEITDLATNKGKIACYVAQKENDLNKLKNSLYKIENELEYFYKERTWVDRFFNKSTINSFWNKDNALKEQIAQMSQDLQILKDSQKKCEVQIEQAQKIVQGKIKIASQESQILQEKQEQEAIALYEQSVRSHQSLGDFYSANEEERNDLKEALSETIKQNYMSYDQQYNLTPQTAGFLAVNGIDYKDFLGFNGTALQQYLHGRTCDIFSQAATLQAKFPHQNNLLTSVVDFADAAHDANKNKQVLLASQLLDVDCYLLKLNRQIIDAAIPYAKAAVSGIVHGVITDNIHMITHFDETCKGVGKALYYVFETAALYDPEPFFDNPELRDQRSAQAGAVLKNLGEKMANSTGPERVEALFRFGANYKSADKIIHAVGGVCGIVQSQVKGMRTLEGAVSMLEEQGIAQEVIQAAEKLEVAAQENIAKNVAAELMEADVHIPKNNPVKSALIVDSVLIEERIAQAEKHFSGIVQESLAEIKALAQKYEKVALEFEGKLQDIIIDVEHIFLPQVMPKYNYKFSKLQGLEEMRVTGWHHGYLSEFEKSGLIDVVKKISKNDCVYIESMWPYGYSTIKKTLFPSCWTREQVMEKILEAFQESNAKIILPRGDFQDLGRTVLGKTLEGIEIEIKLSRNTMQDPWRITTAFVSKEYIGVIK